jgi:hypothetical protein
MPPSRLTRALSLKYTFTGYGHMDNYLSWTQLSLMQQLNVVCNMLAKRAVTTAVIKGYHNRPAQLLPQEDLLNSLG